MRAMIDGSAVSRSAGDVRELSNGDVIMVARSAWERPDWAVYWIAIGVAVGNGADLRVY